MIRSRAALAALLAALVLPASAAAETLTVDPGDDNNACTRGADNRCKTIAQAIGAAQAGDTISIAKGTYAEAVSVPDAKDDLTLRGAGAGETKIVGNGTPDVLAVAADNVKVQSLSVETPASGTGGITLTGVAAQVSEVIVTRANATASGDPLVEVTGGGALDRVFVIASSGATGAPAVLSSGTAGTVLTDVVVISAKGDAARFTNSEANRVVRSTLLTVEPGSDGVDVFSAATSTAKKKVFLDSSILVGGANGAALRAESASATPSSNAGDVAVDARHLTIPTVGKALVLNAAANGLVLDGPKGSVAATVSRSIVHGPSTVEHADALGLTAANTASLTMTRSDADPARITGDGAKNVSETSFTPDEKLFAPGKVSLRADAPVIDKGGDVPTGESETDVNGDPRRVGAASDLGADEFVNQAPDALFGITNKTPRENERIALISGSSDPEGNAGGGIREYRWDFGDGTTETTTAGGVVHTYTRRGTYQVTLQTVDQQGLASPVSPPQTITVTDGLFPKIEIKQPAPGQRLTLNPAARKGSKRKPKPRQLVVFGPAGDEAGLKSVELAVVLVKRDRVRKVRRVPRSRRSQVRVCEHFSGRFFVKRACDKEVWIPALVNAANWAYVSRAGVRLPAGRYELRVRATDNSGLLTTPSTRDKTIVSFRVR